MKRCILPCALVAMTPLAALAEGLSIEPGQWRTTMTMTMSMMPQPQVQTTEDCIVKDTLGPEDFQSENDDSGCEFSEMTIDGDTATWSLSCPSEMGNMQGEWTVTSKGDTITGSGAMETEMQGQKIGYNMSWEGERIGDCP